MCVPEIRGNEWQYIKECLDTNWISSAGQYVKRFEDDLAEYVGSKYAIATVNGTAALHVALLVAGVEPDDEVLVSDLTFIAPANVTRYVGAWPVFIDCEPDYWQMDANRVREFLEQECVWQSGELRNKTSGRRVKSILPVHVLGHPVDMDPIIALAEQFGLTVIEDATESLGASHRARKVGQLGDIACFSFNGNKLLSTGGGGMVVTDNEEWAERARHLTTQSKADTVEYVHDEVGFNYRLTNILAAVGVAQLEQIDEYLAAKRLIATAYEIAFADIAGIAPMQEASWATSSWWMYTVLVNESEFGSDSRDLLNRLSLLNIETRPLWQPMHQSPAHENSTYHGSGVSERLYRTAISLPCSVGLTNESQQRVIEAMSTGGG